MDVDSLYPIKMTHKFYILMIQLKLFILTNLIWIS